MNNVLLVFPYNLRDKRADFEKIITKFKEKGYTIINYNFIKEDFNIKNLPLYINHAKEKMNSKINKISVLSNVIEVIFAWYRVYNSLVDDFIYYIDSNNFAGKFFNDNSIEDNFHILLSSFIGIENETIQGKIFLNINLDNYRSLFDFIITNSNFRYFDTLVNFNYENVRSKVLLKKTYNYKGYLLSFDIYSENYKEEIVSISGDFNTNIQLDDGLINLLKENPYFIDKLVIELYRRVDLNKISPFYLKLFKSLKESDKKNKDMIFNNIMNYLRKKEVDFKVKVGLLSLLVILKPEEEVILSNIMKTLLEDTDNIQYYYPILANTLSYLSTDNVKMYDNYYVDRRKIRDKIVDYIKKDITVKRSEKTNEKHVAIIAHQLLSMLHSPTKMLIKYVNYIKKEHPDYKIKIFVEDVFAHNNSEIIIPYCYLSAVGKTLEKNHLEYLHDDIDIYYSDPKYTRKQRTIDLIEEINNFNPEIVWAFGPMSIALDFLYEYYPTLYISMSADSFFIESADVHMYMDTKLVLEKNKKYNMLSEDKVYERILINIHEDLKPYKNIKKSDYAITEDDFVLITVGNRLDAEMDNDYIDYICNFLVDRKDVKWLIVGKAKLNYLNENYNTLLDNQIIKISYEKDLPALYKICDVYINPVRSGGGASVFIAINQKLPVITLSEVSDAITAIGMNNGAGSNLDEYIKELELLYKDTNYKKQKINLMEERLKKLYYKNGVKQFLDFFEIAKENFNKRKNKG